MALRLTAKQFRSLTRQPARPKYANRKTVVDGQRFDSQFEADHWRVLQLRVAAGEVRALERQVVYRLIVNGVKICKFIVDFRYEERSNGKWRTIVADCKSPITRREPKYRLKCKLLKALYGITVHEVVKTR
jgi:hypothetical protein